MDKKKVREVIAWMENERRIHKYGIHVSPSIPKEQINLIEEYYNLAIEALEKQLPKKVEYEDGFSNNGFARYRMAKCPTCDRWYNSNEGAIYCVNCGRRLDWSE